MMTAAKSLSEATMEEEEAKKKKKKEAKAKASSKSSDGSSVMSALGGGAGLMSTGLSVGAGLVDRNAQKKAQEAADPRPKRRNIARGVENIKEKDRKRQAGLATLSQAMMDWSRALR